MPSRVPPFLYLCLLLFIYAPLPLTRGAELPPASQVIETGEELAALYRRAHSLFLAGKYAESLKDFDAFLDVSLQERSR